MRSTFYGIEIGRTGINVSQKGLDVTGHNIANVDTAGYTRQRLMTTAYDPHSAMMKFKNVDLGAVGGGARIKLVDQIRSTFLDRQFRTEQSLYSYWDTRVTGLSYVESLFEGTDASAISQSIVDMFSAFNTVGTEANDGSQRTVVRSEAQTLCDNFKQVYDRLVDLQETQNTSVETVVGQINDYAVNIAQLNKAIYYYELDGQPANDLRDKRNLLLDQMSELIDITYEETADNKLIVRVDGHELVNYTTTTAMELQTFTDPLTGNTYSQPCWIEGGTVTLFKPEDLGGELGSHLALRDNSTNETPGIPYFIELVNDLARAIVESVNAVHVTGYTHPASNIASRNGVNFFDVPGGDIANVTAANISLSQEILDNVYNIAASSELIRLDVPSGSDELQEGNQEIAKLIAALIDRTDIVLSDGTSIGSLYGFMSSIELEVATTLKQAKDYFSNHNTQLLSVDNQRTSVSGVSLDEEMTSLIKYQHAYSGASRVITAMDEALETLINRTGRVGL